MRKFAIALTASLLTWSSGNAAKDCSHITNPDELDLGGYPIGTAEQDFDTVQRLACFRFTSKVLGLTFEPDHLCVRVDHDEKPPVALKLPSGKSLDISGDYSSATLRPEFDRKILACYGLLGSPA
jgi:hypothetical protein